MVEEVVIEKEGNIVFPSSFAERYMDPVVSVKFYLSEDKNYIGVRFFREDEDFEEVFGVVPAPRNPRSKERKARIESPDFDIDFSDLSEDVVCELQRQNPSFYYFSVGDLDASISP